MVHTPQHKLILAQRRITKKVIVPEHSKSVSQLHSTSCAYELRHKTKMMLHLSKADHWLTSHPLLELAAHAVHLFAVISVCGGWETSWRHSCLVWPLVQCPWSPGAHGPSPEPMQTLAAVPSILALQLWPCTPCCLHAGMQWERCSFRDIQQPVHLPNLSMKCLLQLGQRYLSWHCLDEFELKANKIIPKAVRDYCHTVLWGWQTEKPRRPIF